MGKCQIVFHDNSRCDRISVHNVVLDDGKIISICHPCYVAIIEWRPPCGTDDQSQAVSGGRGVGDESV